MDTQNEEVVVDDRRAAIEAAFEAEEASSSVPSTPEPEKQLQAPETPVGETTKAPVAEEAKPSSEAKVQPTDEKSGEKSLDVEKPPQSWRPAQKAKWAALDPDIRQEVLRRDREITQTLSQTAQARQIASQVNEVLSPFSARFQELDAHPLVAVRELLRADQMLSTGPMQIRAQKMADLINDYEIDLEALDMALSGRVNPSPVVDSRVEALLAERLGPLQKFYEQQQAREKYQEQAELRRGEETLASMEADTDKYPHLVSVKEDMADIIEIQAKRGVYLSLEQAYSRAIGMNPDVAGQVQAAKTAGQEKLAALAANARAQKALKASKSVAGTPNTGASGSANPNDRRATIEAAFEAASGR